MFSNTLKRPAATLAVAAGLLAAAGPASAIQFRGDGNDAINVKAAPQGVLITNGTADDQMMIVAEAKGTPVGITWNPGQGDDIAGRALILPWLWDNQVNVGAAPQGVAVAGPRAHGSDIKAWQTTHQTSGSFMR